MAIFRFLVDADPSVLDQVPVNYVGLSTAAIIRKKVCSELYEKLTYLVFEKRVVHTLLEFVPTWENPKWVSRFWKPEEKSLIIPAGVAVVASSTPVDMEPPKQPMAYLTADKVMRFPTEEQEKSYESAMREYTRLEALHVAKERARLATELVYLVQWCWELGIEKVCFYSAVRDVADGLEQNLGIQGGKGGVIVLVKGTGDPQRVQIGDLTDSDSERTMTVYVAYEAEFPLRECFDFVMTTTQDSPLVALLSFVCLGAPVITPKAKSFSRTFFNEALEHYTATVRQEQKKR